MKNQTNKKQELKRLIIPLLSSMNKISMFLCRDKDKAEDLVAETLLKVCENIHRLKDITKFKSWVFKIMNNTFITNYRNEKKLNTVKLVDHIVDKGTEINNRNTATLSIWGSNPEQYLINKLLDEDIKRNINLLPEEFRITVVLCDVGNFSYKEISEITQVPVGTVRSRLSRGRAILQSKLQHLALEMGIIKKKKPGKSGEVCTCN